MRYGRGGDCFSLGQCRRGGFKIDLSGTDLKLRDDIKWISWGAPKTGSRMINFTKSPDFTQASAVCGGSCGGCQPNTGRIYFTPSFCDAPYRKFIHQSSVDNKSKVNRFNLAVPVRVSRSLASQRGEQRPIAPKRKFGGPTSHFIP